MATPCLIALSRSTWTNCCGTLGRNVVVTPAISGRFRAAARNVFKLLARNSTSLPARSSRTKVNPPEVPTPGIGTSGGFTFVLEDRAGKDVEFLASNLNTFLAAARKRPEIAGVTTTFLPSVPQQFVQVDRDKAIKQGVAIK